MRAYSSLSLIRTHVDPIARYSMMLLLLLVLLLLLMAAKVFSFVEVIVRS